MYSNIKIGLLGGDLRQLALARCLAARGFETAVWGLGAYGSELGGAVRCVNYSDAICGAAAVILPLPVSNDGVRLSCPLGEDCDLRLTRIMEILPKNALLLAGKADGALRALAQEKQIKLIDYFDGEALKIKNARPTAEGAIAIAMNEMPITMQDSRCAVLGYGRIGRVLAQMLTGLGASVSVFARKPSDLAWAEVEGAQPLPFRDLKDHADAFDVMFNTVPACVLHAEILDRLPKETLIIDLAAAPGGVDIKTARELGVKVIWALSLPGKTAPYTAGKIICESVIEILKEEGVTE